MTDTLVKKQARRVVEAHARKPDPHGDRAYVDQRVAGWRSGPGFADWLPDDPGQDQFIGDEDEHPRGLAVGKPTGDPGDPGIQGVLMERSETPGDRGMAVVGYVNQPVRVGSPGASANAPLELSGQPLLLMGPQLAQVQNPVLETHYLLLGPSSALPDGRHVAPLVLGPEYIPQQQETATDTRDIPLDGVGTLETVVTLGPLANSYAPVVSSFAYEVRLSEEAGRTVNFDVEIWLNQGSGYTFVFRDEYALSGQALNTNYSAPIELVTLNPGDLLQMRVSGLDTHPQSDGWVRGATRESRLQVRQG